MESRKQKDVSVRFAKALRDAVDATYCMGGASQDEYRAACADFLMTTANMFLRAIDTDVEVPAHR
jgi:hypothetical protein